MSGVEFLLAVRHLFPSIQVIAMSGAFSGTCVPAGVVANAFFEKGSDPALLIKAVSAMTEPGLPFRRQRSTERPTPPPNVRTVPVFPLRSPIDMGLSVFACAASRLEMNG